MTIAQRKALDDTSCILEQVDRLLEPVAGYHDDVADIVAQIAGIQVLVGVARERLPSSF